MTNINHSNKLTIFYTISEPMITTVVNDINELIDLIKEDIYVYQKSSLEISDGRGNSISIDPEEIEKYFVMNWNDFVFKVYGVPEFLLNISSDSVKQTRSNWERDQKEKNSELENLIKNKVELLFEERKDI